MTGFSPEWLKLREGADVRSRNAGVGEAVAAKFALRASVNVVDLGCGTGANLRATATLLPNRQQWTLVDHDAALLSAAQKELSHWADEAVSEGDGLRLKKGHAEIAVHFKAADLARDLDAALGEHADLVTASALFDLVSPEFIRAFTKAAASRRAAVYALLTYNGVHRWTPHRPADNQMGSAFHRHMMRDKGFGPAAGPAAAAELVDHLRLEGYMVLEGGSPWTLGRNDRMLIEELTRNHAIAVGETGAVDDRTIAAWVNVQRSGAEVGHTDIFAVPSMMTEF